ncbi:hypothetical protein I4F81_004456 [Pyropia yezoensis]|uniref:Uncharacterized protein n=1 Tax=Pyropia yezoensis TaxID=2788 RepID=A0ACC3BVF6_PYRYE|nr:hypothetical protein I4F81_004456 [Neopyropia yezoensis]
MPKDCTSVASRGALGESTTIDKVEWSWSGIHVADPDFHLVWRLLNARFLGGNIGGGVAAAAPSDGGAPAAASAGPARGGRPPTTPAKRGSSAGGQSGRGTKRAEAEPVVPSPTSVRKLRHRKAAGKYAKTLEVASSLFVEQEQRATVVRPPFVLGRVKPFSNRPFGVVVVYAQFPSLLDTTWKKTITWTAYCRKVLIQKKGGRYEIVFKPNRVPTEDSVGQRNGNEPLARADDAAAVSAAAAAAAAGTGTGTVLAVGTENESAGEGAGAAAGEDEGTEEPGEDSDVDQDVGPTTAMDASAGDRVRASTTRRSASPAVVVGPAGEDASAAEETGVAELEAVGRSAAGASMTSSGGTPTAGTGDPTSSTGGANGAPTDSWDATDFAVADLFEDDPDASLPEFTPLPDTLQRHFITALEKSKAWGAPEEDEQIQWSVITQWPASCFTLIDNQMAHASRGRRARSQQTRHRLHPHED